MAYARHGDQARAKASVDALLRLDPKFSLSKFERPDPTGLVAYREFWETKLVPAGRLAGLPE